MTYLWGLGTSYSKRENVWWLRVWVHLELSKCSSMPFNWLAYFPLNWIQLHCSNYSTLLKNKSYKTKHRHWKTSLTPILHKQIFMLYNKKTRKASKKMIKSVFPLWSLDLFSYRLNCFMSLVLQHLSNLMDMWIWMESFSWHFVKL